MARKETVKELSRWEANICHIIYIVLLFNWSLLLVFEGEM